MNFQVQQGGNDTFYGKEDAMLAQGIKGKKRLLFCDFCIIPINKQGREVMNSL
jgi:hypothetical protein